MNKTSFFLIWHLNVRLNKKKHSGNVNRLWSNAFQMKASTSTFHTEFFFFFVDSWEEVTRQEKKSKFLEENTHKYDLGTQ